MKQIDTPLTVILVGITGDLSRKKILPAVFQLFKKGVLPRQFQLIGVARRNLPQAEFKQLISHAIGADESSQDWADFSRCLHFVRGDVTEKATFEKLKEVHDKMNHCGNHLWYVATLPNLYLPVIQNIKAVGMQKTNCGWTKFLLEKPFGTSLSTSQKLNQELLQVFDEDQIYRIDHFLAKETIQNLMVFRFGNGIFENLWNKKYVDNIQVTASETMGVAGREAFYDGTGVVRDVVQNHVLQMLAMSLMEEPANLSPSSIHKRRMEFLNELENISTNEIERRVAFGQYTAGEIDGQQVQAYREEDELLANSKTATAMAAKLFVHSPRWEGVPIYIRAGKRMQQSVTEINFQFKEPSNAMFRESGQKQLPNVLTLRIQPNEGVVLRINVKQPGLSLSMKEAPMQFCYKSEFQMGLVEAYEKLISDAVEGDPTLFPQAADINASWQSVQPILDFLDERDIKPAIYEAGSWGPAAFQDLIERDGRSWIEPSPDVCNI